MADDFSCTKFSNDFMRFTFVKNILHRALRIHFAQMRRHDLHVITCSVSRRRTDNKVWPIFQRKRKCLPRSQKIQIKIGYYYQVRYRGEIGRCTETRNSTHKLPEGGLQVYRGFIHQWHLYFPTFIYHRI